MPRARTAADAPPEKHPFHLFRPRTRVKTAGNKHEAIWINRPFYGIVYRSLEGRRFSDANTRASMANLEYGLQGKKQRLTSIFDYDRLDELV